MGSQPEIDVGRFLAGLLYEHEAVALPGLGRFETRYKPAEVDRVQGRLFPPSKRLIFKPEQEEDDGRLAARLRDRHGLSQEEAERRVYHFVQQIKRAVEQREIVVFPQVGRLYEDYQHHLQFIPDSTNFNPSTYGLPALHYQATLGRTEIKRADPPARREEVAASTGMRVRAALRRHVSLIGTVLVLLFALAIYLVLPKNPLGTAPPPAERVIPPDRLNQPPMPDNLPATPGPAEPDDGFDTESSTITPDQHEAVIAIGLFSTPENIDRLVRAIYQTGYEPYLESRGDFTLVGVQRAFENEAELQRILQDVQQAFSPDAFVLQRSDQ